MNIADPNLISTFIRLSDSVIGLNSRVSSHLKLLLGYDLSTQQQQQQQESIFIYHFVSSIALVGFGPTVVIPVFPVGWELRTATCNLQPATCEPRRYRCLVFSFDRPAACF